MRPESIAAIAPLFTPLPRLNSWQWAEANVDYSRVRNYDTEWKGMYSADYMPYWREAMESITDPECKEVWVLKCSRSGGSENVLLTSMRYIVACSPAPMLYMSGQEGSTGKFMETRIKPGFGLADATRAAYEPARKREYEIMFDSMDLIAGWPANKMVFKQSGFPFIFADEVSTWPEFAADMLRERQANYAFPHLIGISSPDPGQKRGSDEDPIFIEYNSTDQRKWHCVDPKTGNLFVFRLGGKDTVDGVKWDSDAKRADETWDINKVSETAHYITPDGTRIDDVDRIKVSATGKWVPTNNKAIKGRRGYHVTRFMVPFKVGSFGHIASAFLTAKAKGQIALRTFIYEYLAEPYYAAKIITADDEIEKREGAYKRGYKIASEVEYSPIYIGKKSLTFVTVDVQKHSMYWLAREWIDGGDSGLVDYGHCDRWEDIKAAAIKYGSRKNWVDNSYPERAFEVAQQCQSGVMAGGVPCYGRDNLIRGNIVRVPFEIHNNRDPFEGTANAGRIKLSTVTHHPNTLKTMLWGMVNGVDSHRWYVFRDTDGIYRAQMSAEECIDGAWLARRRDNHYWDCEVLQLLAAMIFGVYRQINMTSTLEGKAQEVPEIPRTYAQKEKEPQDPRVSYAVSDPEDDDDQSW